MTIYWFFYYLCIQYEECIDNIGQCSSVIFNHTVSISWHKEQENEDCHAGKDGWNHSSQAKHVRGKPRGDRLETIHGIDCEPPFVAVLCLHANCAKVLWAYPGGSIYGAVHDIQGGKGFPNSYRKLLLSPHIQGGLSYRNHPNQGRKYRIYHGNARKGLMWPDC